ncbi:hypothetical protein BaRGS_00029456, partial [Batillaria attramentaria]
KVLGKSSQRMRENGSLWHIQSTDVTEEGTTLDPIVRVKRELTSKSVREEDGGCNIKPFR